MINLILPGLLIAWSFARADVGELVESPVAQCQAAMLEFFPAEGSVAVNMPYRELRISPEAVAYARETEAWADLVDSLARILTSLNPVVTAQLGPTLRATQHPPPGAVAWAAGNAFLKTRPNEIDDTVVANLLFLNHALPKQSFRPYDLGLMSYLLRSTRRAEPKATMPTMGLDDRWRNRMRTVMERPYFRLAIHVFARLPDVRSLMMIAWNRHAPNNQITPERLDNITTEHVRGKVSEGDMHVTTWLVRAFVQQITRASQDDDLRARVKAEDEISREEMFVEAYHYLTTQGVTMEATNLIVDVLDYLYFGSQVPTEPDQMYRAMIEEAKHLLLRLKAEYAAKCTADDRVRREAALASTPVAKREFQLVDFCPSRSPCARKVAKPASPVTAAPSKSHATSPGPAPLAVAAAGSVVASTRIPEGPPPDPARALDHLAMYTGGRGLPLRPGEPYEFRFKRDAVKVTQRVVFKEEVVDRFLAEPEVGRRFLIAFERGRVREQMQNGLKQLRPRYSRQGFRAYQIKTAGSYRAIVTIEDGAWTVHTIVTKKAVARALDNLCAGHAHE